MSECIGKDFLDWHKKQYEEKFQIDPKDAYERTWSCRDFEISHLWQRSVFLAVFLIAIAGAYGNILMSMYFPNEQNSILVSFKAENKDEFKEPVKKIEYTAKAITYQQQGIATGVCWLGITFSLLWVMMAKGSKYWFERYEAGICHYEESYAGEKLRNEDCSYHGKMPTLPPYLYDENVFSTKAGHYSVSKVNATIGIVSLIAFSFLAMFHFGRFLDLRITKLNNLQCALFSISHWLLLGSFLLMILRFLCKSSNIDEQEANR